MSNVITRVSEEILLNMSSITMPVAWKLVDSTNLCPKVLFAHISMSAALLDSRSSAILVASDDEKVVLVNLSFLISGFVNFNSSGRFTI